MLRGVGAALSDTEMQLLLIFAGSDRERQRLAQYLAAHRVDGVLLVSVHADDPLPDLLSQLEIPAVISGRRSADETLPSVDSDNFGGGRAAVEHLIAQGRRTHRPPRRAASTSSAPSAASTATARPCATAGREVDERLIVPGDFTEEGGRRAMTELLDRCPDLDAVFAGSDVMAAGARQVLREAGRRIPDDVALVGYDDSAIARHMDPPLTSVRQPIEEMGRAMIDLLLDEIADRRPAVSRGAGETTGRAAHGAGGAGVFVRGDARVREPSP